MTPVLHLLLLVIAFVCFVVAALGLGQWNRLTAAGLAAFVASMIRW